MLPGRPASKYQRGGLRKGSETLAQKKYKSGPMYPDNSCVEAKSNGK